MRISKGYIKTIKEEAKEYDSVSHELLIKAGFIDQVASGIYTLLPPGVRTIKKIEDIIRQGMRDIGAEELRMPALQPKNLWLKTNKWDSVDVLFKLQSKYKHEYALGMSHEEVVTTLALKYIKSYRDLPLGLYQIGTKFRDEARAKSGILRGREFGMKDLYSFHADQADLNDYYKKVSKAYIKIFKACGLSDVKITEASGGDFTKKFSHEFNVITPAGEVDLVFCDKCDFAQNEELLDKEIKKCPSCGSAGIQREKAIEIGNIFDLHTKYSEAFKLLYTDQDGKNHPVIMGCYGIGITRLLGAIVEVHNDKKSIAWPKSVTPFHAHLVNLVKEDATFADLVYRTLTAEGFDIIYDDREDVSAGEKFATADLIGAPVRLVISVKTKQSVEWKLRDEEKERLYAPAEVLKLLKEFYLL